MNDKQNHTRVVKPRLRFPTFRQVGEWKRKKVGDLIDTITPPKKLLSNQYALSGAFPIIDQSQRYVAGWTDEHDAIISEKLPVIVFGDHTCVLKLVTTPFAQGADGIKIVYASSEVTTEYLYQYLLFDPVVMEDYKRHYSILREKTIAFSEKNSGEQQKIANCLSFVDELIIAEVGKLDALKAHKTGLANELFPAEGETVPRLRFPEFLDAGEWGRKFIRDLGEIVTGSTPSTAKREYYDGTRLFVSPADISDERFIEATKTTLTELGFAQTRAINEGSVLFVCIGSTIGKVAQNLLKCATNQQINSITPTVDYSNAFVYYALEKSSAKISELAGTHAVPIINKTVFGSFEIFFPRFPEQQKIADCLSSIDELITAQSRRVGTLKVYKTGLMQQLFPVLDEVQ